MKSIYLLTAGDHYVVNHNAWERISQHFEVDGKVPHIFEVCECNDCNDQWNRFLRSPLVTFASHPLARRA